MITINPIDLIGNTPLLDISDVFSGLKSKIYLKLEKFNLGSSIKTRIALSMILDAEEEGLLIPGKSHIIEATGGNTGLGLAIIGNIKGYDITLVIPDSFSKSKAAVMRAYGANVLLSDSSKGNDSHISLVKEIVSDRNNFVWLNQFENTSNVNAHYLYTGPEITSHVSVDCFVAGIGSGGTITGIAKHLKNVNDRTIVYGVQPKGCDIINNIFIPHKIEGIAVGITPSILDKSLIDGFIFVSYEEALDMSTLLNRKYGIFVGVSSGANVCAAVKASNNLDSYKNIVTVAPDSGRSYLNNNN